MANRRSFLGFLVISLRGFAPLGFLLGTHLPISIRMTFFSSFCFSESRTHISALFSSLSHTITQAR
jgi:hypothetical protein